MKRKQNDDESGQSFIAQKLFPPKPAESHILFEGSAYGPKICERVITAVEFEEWAFDEWSNSTERRFHVVSIVSHFCNHGYLVDEYLPFPIQFNYETGLKNSRDEEVITMTCSVAVGIECRPMSVGHSEKYGIYMEGDDWHAERISRELNHAEDVMQYIIRSVWVHKLSNRRKRAWKSLERRALSDFQDTQHPNCEHTSAQGTREFPIFDSNARFGKSASLSLDPVSEIYLQSIPPAQEQNESGRFVFCIPLDTTIPFSSLKNASLIEVHRWTITKENAAPPRYRVEPAWRLDVSDVSQAFLVDPPKPVTQTVLATPISCEDWCT